MDASLFARLSPELRNQIYELSYTLPNRVSLGPATGPINAQSALTRTCRQVRRESLLIYYTQARFSAHLNDGPISPLIDWYRAIGPQACLLIPEINVFDMHNHMLSLWSVGMAEEVIANPARRDVSYRVTDVGRLDKNNVRFNAGQYVIQLQPALKEMGLDLRQGYEIYSGNGKEEFNGYCSWFVIVEGAKELKTGPIAAVNAPNAQDAGLPP